MNNTENPSSNHIKLWHPKDQQKLAAMYMKHIKNGFDLTVDEIANYLKCSNNYVQKNIGEHIKHITLNTAAREALLYYEKGSNHEQLFNQQVLFDRNDFHDYLIENCEIVTRYQPYYWEDLSKKAQIRLNELSRQIECKPEVLYESIANSILKTTGEKYRRSFTWIIETLPQVPQRLLRANDLEYGDPLQIEKYIRDNGIKKTKLLSLVRYREEDLKLEKIAVFSLPIEYAKITIIALIEQELLSTDPSER